MTLVIIKMTKIGVYNMADCTDYPTPEDAKRFKNNADSTNEFVTSNEETFIDQDGNEKLTMTGIRASSDTAALAGNDGASLVGTNNGKSVQKRIDDNEIDTNANTSRSISNQSRSISNQSRITVNETDINALQAGQGSGVYGYALLSQLVVDLTPGAGSIAYVTNDPTVTNNGTYIKNGASGTGSWTQSNQDLASQAYQQSLDASEVANYKRTYSVCQTVGASEVVNAECFAFVWSGTTIQLTINNCWVYSPYSASTSGSVSFSNVTATLDYSVNTDYRFACVDLDTVSIFFTNRDGLRALTKDQYVVALIGATTRNIGWCSHSGYTVNGVVSTVTNKDLLKVGLSTGMEGYIDFDFDSNLVRITSVYTQDRASLNGPFTQDVTITSSSRFIMCNPDTGDFKAVDLADDTEYNDDGYIVCAQITPNSNRVHWCSISLEFVKVNGNTLINQYKDKVTPFDSPIFNPGSTGYIDFDFENSQLNIFNMFMIDMKTYGGVITDTVPIPVQGRFVMFNVSTRAFTVLDAGATNALFADDGNRLVAVIRQEQQTVSWVVLRDEFVKVNGVALSSNDPVANYNSLDYVKGQEEICLKYSVPVCDLYRKSGLNYQNKDLYITEDNLHYNEAGYAKQAAITTAFLRKHGGFVDLTGKSIGIFGGSFSVRPASDTEVKDVWVAELGITYTNYGAGGNGFAQPPGFNITEQVPGAAVHDIYILWCSTNDVINKNPIGGLESAPGTDSQAAGISKCIEDLIAKNPDCKILLFNTVKSYLHDYLYDPTVIRT